MNGKIVFLVRNVAPDNFGGGEIYQLLLARELRENGFVPIVISNSRELLRRSKKEGYQTLTPPYIKNQNWSGWRNILLPEYYFGVKKLRRWYQKKYTEYMPCAVNLQSRDDLIAGTLAKKNDGVKVFWTDHADFKNWVLWNVNSRFKNVIGKKIIVLSKEVTAVIFVSENIERETKRMIYPKRIENVMVIRNGVMDRLDEYSDRKETKNSFVFIGRVVEEKGVKELIEAFLVIMKKYPNAELNIYGDGKIKEIRGLCKNCRNINFRGNTDRPLEVMAENDIFVLPSYREGLSLSLLDAAMMGKKIIASDVGGNAEIVKNMKTGLTVPPKNVQKLVEAMLYMLENPKQANTMAKNARKHYEENFNFEKIFVEKMLPLYNNKEEKIK